MKKILLLLLLVTNYCFSQTSGITYQAVVYNPNGEQLPGVDNPYAPLTNQNICLQFGIIDNTGSTEYQEQVQVTTDNFGMVNLLIGTSSQTGGYSIGFNGIEWSAAAKFLKVDIDIQGSCSNFEELSNQPFTYVPFAYYSPASDIPGPAGEDGLKSLINTTDEPAGVNCANGGSRIEVGIDTNNNNILDLDEIDDSLTRFVCDVQDGEDGEVGLKSLINTTDEPAGVNCANGGSRIEIGIDTNNNNILDLDEIDDSLTRFVCDVQDGEDGEVGLKSLINTIDEPAGPNCDTGGTRIEVGIDTNNNNILDPDEIDAGLTRFICNGEVAIKTLINSIAEESGDNCSNGGVKIEVGEDANFNGVLDTDEIDDSLTRYVCNGNDGVDGQDGADGQVNNPISGDPNSDEVYSIIIPSGTSFVNFSLSNNGLRLITTPFGTSVFSDNKYNVDVYDITPIGLNKVGNTIDVTSRGGEYYFIPNFDGTKLYGKEKATDITEIWELVSGTWVITESINLPSSNGLKPRFISNDESILFYSENNSFGSTIVFELNSSNEWINTTTTDQFISTASEDLKYVGSRFLDYDEGDGILYNYEYLGGQFLDRGDPIDIGAPVGNQSGGIYGQQVINNLGNTVAVPIRDLVVPNPYTYGVNIRVFSYDESTNLWTQKGNDISTNSGDKTTMKSLSISPEGSKILAVFSVNEYDSQSQKNAFIAEYEFQSNDWVMSNFVPIYSGFNIQNTIQWSLQKNKTVLIIEQAAAIPGNYLKIKIFD